MEQELTTEQKTAIVVNEIIQAVKNKIVTDLEPQFDKLTNGHHHFTKELADAIITDIKNA